MKKLSGGVCAPLGFLAGATAAGIKAGKATRDDLALVFSEHPAAAAATFTTNLVKAAPVRVSMEHLKQGKVRAIVLNSGNANACTGKPGLADAKRMAESAASHLDLTAKQVLVCSTGRIGVPLPMDRIEKSMPKIALKRSGSTATAQAIMTSDTFAKEIAFTVSTPKGSFRIGGVAKGAGMIDPNMATMLCVVTTDAKLSTSALRDSLRTAVECSFNRITIDGDMSTNDTVIALANGASGITPSPKVFQEALNAVTQALAQMIVLDGEGVSKFIEIEVRRAASPADARLAAEAVANSTLAKCAWAGGDPNWGRIVDALGYSGAALKEEKIAIDYDALPIVRQGLVTDTPWQKLRAVAAQEDFKITIDLGLGKGSHIVWTTDLTEEYVRLNLGE